jgi:hypothetical protein
MMISSILHEVISLIDHELIDLDRGNMRRSLSYRFIITKLIIFIENVMFKQQSLYYFDAGLNLDFYCSFLMIISFLINNLQKAF